MAMSVEQYLTQLENSIHKSLCAQKNHGIRGAKLDQRQALQQIRACLKRLEELEAQIKNGTE